MKVTGKIVVKPFGEDSKSEHEAVYLETSERTYMLQMEDENPFEQPTLHTLEGKRVTVEGEQLQYLFIVKKIKPLS